MNKAEIELCAAARRAREEPLGRGLGSGRIEERRVLGGGDWNRVIRSHGSSCEGLGKSAGAAKHELKMMKPRQDATDQFESQARAQK